VRGLARRLRSNFGIRSSRMTIRSQMAWYWRWILNVLAMVAVAGAVWWLVENSYRITGFNREEAKQQIASLGEENAKLKRDLEAAKASLGERERQAAIDKASQTELARNVTQLQEENATLKEDLGFLRNIMSSGTTPLCVASNVFSSGAGPDSTSFSSRRPVVPMMSLSDPIFLSWRSCPRKSSSVSVPAFMRSSCASIRSRRSGCRLTP